MEPLKIEVGGVYRTRDKRIMLILWDSGHRVYPYSGISLFAKRPNVALSEWTKGGQYNTSIDEHPYDLVEYLGNITDLPAVKALTSTPDAK